MYPGTWGHKGTQISSPCPCWSLLISISSPQRSPVTHLCSQHPVCQRVSTCLKITSDPHGHRRAGILKCHVASVLCCVTESTGFHGPPNQSQDSKEVEEGCGQDPVQHHSPGPGPSLLGCMWPNGQCRCWRGHRRSNQGGRKTTAKRMDFGLTYWPHQFLAVWSWASCSASVSVS